jgi:hypothetical protein
MSNAGSAFLAYFYFDFKDTSKQDSALYYHPFLSNSPINQIYSVTPFSHCTPHTNEDLEQPTDDTLARCLKNILTGMG